VALVIICGGMPHYLSIGVPGVPYPEDTNLPVAWEQMGDAVERIEKRVEFGSRRDPLVVGMDKYFIASGLAFYRHDPVEQVTQRINNTTSRNLIGKNALMYDYWHPYDGQIGGRAIMVRFRPKDLSDTRIAPYFEYLGSLHAVGLRKDGIAAITGRWEREKCSGTSQKPGQSGF
jgi:dolichol-phosphate mannosyltransferase